MKELQDIDSHVKLHEENVNNVDTAAVSQMNNAGKLQAIYDILKAAEPILKLLKGFLFFKPKWQAVIQKLIDAIDSIEPTVEG